MTEREDPWFSVDERGKHLCFSKEAIPPRIVLQAMGYRVKHLLLI